jgi:two-component system, sensor histidine kinase
MPIKGPNGKNVGVLCVVDPKPKKLNSDQIDALKTLREQVRIFFLLKKQNKELLVAKLKAEQLSRTKDEFI